MGEAHCLIYDYSMAFGFQFHKEPKPDRKLVTSSMKYKLCQRELPGLQQTRIKWWVQGTHNVINTSSDATCNDNEIGECFRELKLMCIGQRYTDQLISQMMSCPQYLQTVRQQITEHKTNNLEMITHVPRKPFPQRLSMFIRWGQLPSSSGGLGHWWLQWHHRCVLGQWQPDGIPHLFRASAPHIGTSLKG